METKHKWLSANIRPRRAETDPLSSESSWPDSSAAAFSPGPSAQTCTLSTTLSYSLFHLDTSGIAGAATFNRDGEPPLAISSCRHGDEGQCIGQLLTQRFSGVFFYHRCQHNLVVAFSTKRSEESHYSSVLPLPAKITLLSSFIDHKL